MHSQPQHKVETSGHLHTLTTLTLVPTGYGAGWAPKADLDMVVKRKNPFSAPAMNQTPVIWPTA